MTQIDTISNGSTGLRTYLYYLLAPATGSSLNVNLTVSGNATMLMHAGAIIGTATSTPVDTFNSVTASSGTSLNNSLTTIQAKTLLVGIGCGTAATLAAGAGETQGVATKTQSGVRSFMSYKYVMSSGSNSMQSTAGTSNAMNNTAGAIKEAVASTGNFFMFM